MINKKGEESLKTQDFNEAKTTGQKNQVKGNKKGEEFLRSSS
jgi:hypothetical protein